jgi:hypothetical protein
VHPFACNAHPHADRSPWDLLAIARMNDGRPHPPPKVIQALSKILQFLSKVIPVSDSIQVLSKVIQVSDLIRVLSKSIQVSDYIQAGLELFKSVLI